MSRKSKTTNSPWGCVLEEIIAKNISVYRDLRGLSQKGLADACKVTPAAISAIETGKSKPSFVMLDKIAKALKIPAHLLLVDSKNN